MANDCHEREVVDANYPHPPNFPLYHFQFVYWYTIALSNDTLRCIRSTSIVIRQRKLCLSLLRLLRHKCRLLRFRGEERRESSEGVHFNTAKGDKLISSYEVECRTARAKKVESTENKVNLSLQNSKDKAPLILPFTLIVSQKNHSYPIVRRRHNLMAHKWQWQQAWPLHSHRINSSNNTQSPRVATISSPLTAWLIRRSTNSQGGNQLILIVSCVYRTSRNSPEPVLILAEAEQAHPTGKSRTHGRRGRQRGMDARQ